MRETFLIIQIVVSILLIISILLQNRAEGLGTVFGGGGEIFRAKRGFEKFLYNATIVLMIVFIIISFELIKLS